MLAEIDFWLVGWFEKTTHRWQKLTGKNCFWLARIFTLFGGLSAGYLVTVAYLVFHANFSLAIYAGILGLTLFLEILFLFASIRIIEVRIGSSNPFKYVEQFERIWRIVFYPIFTLIWATGFYLIDRLSLISAIFCASAFIWLTIAWYLKCCDPLPPGTSKVKEWKNKLVSAVKGVFAPAPRPSPAH